MRLYDECVESCYDLIEEEEEFEEFAKTHDVKLLKPSEIKEKLGEYIIGQERAKKYFQLQYIIISRELHIKCRISMMLNYKNRMFY